MTQARPYRGEFEVNGRILTRRYIGASHGLEYTWGGRSIVVDLGPDIPAVGLTAVEQILLWGMVDRRGVTTMWLSDFYPDTRGKRGDMALSVESQRNLLTPGGTYGEPITEGLRAVYQTLPDAVLERLRMDKATVLTLTFKIGAAATYTSLEVPRDEIINKPAQVAGKILLLA